MRDDPEFNINLVQEVERYPCLYDHTLDDYSRRHVQEKAWKEVAEKIGETASDCKARWKNLRDRFIKIKNQCAASGSGTARKKKTYYLAEYMNYLDKIGELRPSNADVNSINSVDAFLPDNGDNVNSFRGLEEESESIADDHSAPQLPADSNAQSDNEPSCSFDWKTTPGQLHSNCVDKIEIKGVSSLVRPKKCYRKRELQSSPSTSIEEIKRSAIEYFNMKKESQRQSKKSFLEDPDTAFLFSILPDIKQMDDHVKRRFKVRLLQLVEETLDGQ